VLWVRYYPQDWLSKLASVAKSSDFAHRRLADLVWAGGEWPSSEPEILARLVRSKPPALPAILKDLALLGWFSEGGRFQNARVAQVRRDAAKALTARRALGKLAARNRWVRRDHAGGMPAACKPDADGIAAAYKPHAGGIATAYPPDAGGITSVMPEVCRLDGKTDKSTSTTVNTAERLTLNGLPREKAAESPEKDFLTAVGEMMEAWKKGAGTSEMKNWGGWWRNKFRKSPKKARAVLNDVRSLVNERRITKNPGNAAV
jgi:hypothetical protein